MPKGVVIAFASPAFAKAGRSVKSVSPLSSAPVVMLNGAAEAMKRFGLNEVFQGN